MNRNVKSSYNKSNFPNNENNENKNNAILKMTSDNKNLNKIYSTIKDPFRDKTQETNKSNKLPDISKKLKPKTIDEMI